MIPRRRIDLDWADVADLVAGFWRSEAGQRAEVAAFERQLASFLGLPCVRATASGRDALELILEGLGLGPGDTVIVPAYTLGELIPLLQDRGLTLVAADVDPASFNLTAAGVAARITPQTRAILVVHLLGAPCEIEAICGLGRERGIAVIEDCAHAFGAEVAGRKLGSFGDAALFSLEVNKQLPTYGGGLLATRSPALADLVAARLAERPYRAWPAQRKALLKMLEELLVRSPLYAVLARLLFGGGAPWFEAFYRGAQRRVRPDRLAYAGFQASVGRRRLDRFAERNRRRNADWEALARELPPGWRAQRRADFGTPVFYNFVATVDTPLEPLRHAALARGVDLGIGSEVMDDVAGLLGQDDCPGARSAAARAVLLPLHDGLTPRRRRHLLRVLAEVGA